VTLSSFPQSAEVMPPAATTTFDPESAKSVVSVVSPDIASVTALPSPPVVLMDETIVPAAAEQAIVGFDGVSTIANGAGMAPALGNVTMSEVIESLLVSLAVAVCTPVADVILSSASGCLVVDGVVDSCGCWRAVKTRIQACRYLPRVVVGVSGRIDRLS
jgi:hypothetical protein